MWGWSKKADYEPAILDVRLEIGFGESESKLELPIRWRELLSRTQSLERRRLLEHVSSAAKQCRGEVDALEAAMQELRPMLCPEALFASPWQVLDAFAIEGACGDGRQAELRDRLGSYYNSLSRCLIACLPEPNTRGRMAAWRIVDKWSGGVGLLRMLRNNMVHAATIWVAGWNFMDMFGRLQGEWQSAAEQLEPLRETL